MRLHDRRGADAAAAALRVAFAFAAVSSLVLSLVCLPHGAVAVAGQDCPEGTYGTWCNLTFSECATVECSGHGTCNGTAGVCNCTAGWYTVPSVAGEFAKCNQTAATCSVLRCGGHGECANDTSTCVCPTGTFGSMCYWTAAQCRLFRCFSRGDCTGALSGCACDHPELNATANCNSCNQPYYTNVAANCSECAEGYYGDGCTTTSANCASIRCHDNGECTGDDDGCLCTGVYSGSEVVGCIYHLCGTGGTPSLDKLRCVCDSMHYLNESTYPQCVANCSGHGTFDTVTSTCTCDLAYTGTHCEESLAVLFEGFNDGYMDWYIVLAIWGSTLLCACCVCTCCAWWDFVDRSGALADVYDKGAMTILKRACCFCWYDRHDDEPDKPWYTERNGIKQD